MINNYLNTHDAMIVSMTKKAKLSLLYAHRQFQYGNQWEEQIVASQSFRAGYDAALLILKQFVKDETHFNRIVEYYFKPGQHQLWGDKLRTEHEKN